MGTRTLLRRVLDQKVKIVKVKRKIRLTSKTSVQITGPWAHEVSESDGSSDFEPNLNRNGKVCGIFVNKRRSNYMVMWARELSEQAWRYRSTRSKLPSPRQGCVRGPACRQNRRAGVSFRATRHHPPRGGVSLESVGTTAKHSVIGREKIHTRAWYLSLPYEADR